MKVFFKKKLIISSFIKVLPVINYSSLIKFIFKTILKQTQIKSYFKSINRLLIYWDR
jgi:hypothetical protein